MKNARCTLIYKFFVSQIQFGYYKTGEFLPSIEDLCSIYHASSRTVRSAYLQMQKDGYVTLSSGRKTTVVYQATPEECARNRRSYYLARKDTSLELNEAMKLLLLPLLRIGCARLSPQAMDDIRQMAVKLKDGDFYISFFGGNAMITAAGNQLAGALFDEVISFYQFPHVLLRFAGRELEVRQFQALSAKMVAACDQNDRPAFYNAYLGIQTYMNDVLNHYMALAEQLLPVPEQVPFVWNLYREHSQYCYTVAAQLIKEIYISCRYLPGDTLPYHARLADMYRVSYMTIRRTMAILETMGVVSVRQGVGTTITEPQPKPARYQDSAISRIHNMALDAMEILNLSFDGLTAQFPAVWNTRDCIEMLRTQKKEGYSSPAFITCMDFLLRDSPNRSLQSIWERLFEVLLLDLPLLAGDAVQVLPDALIRSLESGDVKSFYLALKAQMLRVYEAAKTVRDSLPEPDSEPQRTKMEMFQEQSHFPE